jgi:hypothetical protein
VRFDAGLTLLGHIAPVVLPPGVVIPRYVPRRVVPEYFSTVNGTLMGPVDGRNPLFFASVLLKGVQVYRNGLAQTYLSDVVHQGYNGITFLPGSIPQPGDIIECWGFPGQG